MKCYHLFNMEVIINKETRILIVAPHQDDETIGCGGLLALYGPQCDVLLLTDGRLGNAEQYKNEKELIQIRNKELEKVVKMANIRQLFKLSICNNTLSKNKNVVSQFDISSYDYIFIPSRNDEQPDHKAVYPILKSMINIQHSKAVLMEYEVWTPLQTPTWFLDISSVIDKKKKMINQYKSQLKGKNYLNATLGLNMYRGMFRNYQYAEAYMDSRYSGLKVKVYEALPDNLKETIKNMI